MKRITALLAATALMMLTTSVWAVPITGTINFTGSEILVPPGTDLLGATGINFGASQTEGLGSGTYAAIAAGTPVIFTDFTFKPTSGVIPIPSLWTMTHLGNSYSFDLDTVNIEFQSKNFLNLFAEGVLHATGYDDTPGSWFYSSQDGGTAFSAESSPAPVPEPGTIVLLGAGLFALTVFGRRRMNQDPSRDAV